MMGMTVKQLRDCVQRDNFYEGLRLEMGCGIVLQYFPNVMGSVQEVYIESWWSMDHLWGVDFFGSDDAVNDFFDAMGGIVHVLEILE